MSIPCHTVHGAKKEVEVVCDKEWADRKQSDRERKAGNFGRMNPHRQATSIQAWKTQACHDSDCKQREVTLSLFTAFITLSITDYKCTPHGLVLYALLHHVVPSSLNLRPTREGRRSSQVPRRPLTVAMECSGCFIACGSNCTYIWRSFVEINPTAGFLLVPATGQYSHNALKYVTTCQPKGKRTSFTCCVYSVEIIVCWRVCFSYKPMV